MRKAAPPFVSSSDGGVVERNGRRTQSTLRPLWLALRWEEYGREMGLVGQGRTRLVDGIRIHPRYQKVFERLAVFLEQAQISGEDYFTAVKEVYRYRKARHWSWRPWTTQLGSPRYNDWVRQHLELRQERLAGRTTGEGVGYLRAERRYPWKSADQELRQDCRHYLDFRQLYPHLRPERFWLMFVGEFSGAFLFICDEWRPALECFCSPEQRAAIRLLSENEELAAHVRAIAEEILKGSSPWTKTQGYGSRAMATNQQHL